MTACLSVETWGLECIWHHNYMHDNSAAAAGNLVV